MEPRRALLTVGFVAGATTALLVALVINLARARADVPRAGILNGWTVVRDDETLVCESPSIFVAARQIECE